MTVSARDRLLQFKKSQPRTPRLTRHTVQARGLSFAVFTSPEVHGALPLVCVNGGMLYSHALLWPALAPLAVHRQLVLYDQRGRGASQAPPAVKNSRIEYDAGDVPALREARKLKDRTVFMDFRTDPTENVFPMVKAGKGINEMLLGSEDL